LYGKWTDISTVSNQIRSIHTRHATGTCIINVYTDISADELTRYCGSRTIGREEEAAKRGVN
jgi:hypothetical protein